MKPAVATSGTLTAEVPMANPLKTWSKAPKPQGSEQRKWERYLCPPETCCSVSLAAGGEPAQGQIKNLSAGGISMVVNRKVPLGTTVTVHLGHAGRSYACSLQMGVIYTIEDANGGFVIGGPFDRELSNEELQKLL